MVKETSKDLEKWEKIKKVYDKHAKKYKLPKFEDIDKEFEVRRIKEPLFVLRNIIRVIMQIFQNQANIFIPVLNPRPDDIHSMIEVGTFTKEEKKKVLDLFKRLGFYVHKAVCADFGTEKEQAEFIKDVWKNWPAIKKQTIKFVSKISKEWKKDIKYQKLDVNYLG